MNLPNQQMRYDIQYVNQSAPLKSSCNGLKITGISNLYVLGFVVFVLSFTIADPNPEIFLKKKDSVVYSQVQVITGKATGISGTGSGTLFVNEEEHPLYFGSDGAFELEISLKDSLSDIYAYMEADGKTATSETIRLSMGYRLRPEIEIIPEADGREVTIRAEILENPLEEPVEWIWKEDPENKFSVNITGKTGSDVQFTLPVDVPGGEYYYNVTGITESGHRTSARTFITADSTQITPFDISNDYAGWIDQAIVYGITPYIFANGGQFSHITQKIPEIADMGVNTLWIQPVYETYEKGQGYGITNYFKVRSDLGTEQDLRDLVETAHKHELRVLFDFVPNHSSIEHPYAQEAVQLGEASHYYDFYQRRFDSVRYSQHYQRHPEGFIHYFWEHLPNLNYHNPEVKRWITEAGRYWIEEFDIDGYRIDAVWGVNARNPEFMQEWRRALKRVKPEVMLLGEDKASREETFDQRFDVAYNWTESESWVSQWVWQTTFSEEQNPTIFNDSDPDNRVNLLRNSLTNNGNGYHPDTRILRFLENNDTFRFIDTHGPERTKMAAALVFSLHGIPLVFNGQEIGAGSHPYRTLSIYNMNRPIESQSRFGLYEYYRHLIRIRSDFSALNTQNFEEISSTPSNSIYSFRRWDGDQNIFVVVNMGAAIIPAKLHIPVEKLNLEPGEAYYLSDLISGEFFEVRPEDLNEFSLYVEGFTTRLLILDKEVVETAGNDSDESRSSEYFELYQNYPNPFTPSTTIRWHLPESEFVSLRIYDLLGRQIETLVNEVHPPGEHHTIFNAPDLASGLYLYKLSTENRTATRSMMLIK